MREIRDMLELLDARPDSPAALATLVGVEGSSYRLPGARLLWFPDGTRTGSISGGCLEEDVIGRARRVVDSGRAEVATYNTMAENDLVWGTGTGCDGKVTILIEKISLPRPAWIGALRENQRVLRPTPLVVVHAASDESPLGTRLAGDAIGGGNGTSVFRDDVQPPRELLVFGAGDDARPLARLASEIGWNVTIVDSRAAYATSDRFPTAARVVVCPPEKIRANLKPGPRSLVVVMTHRYRDDSVLLRELLPASLAYLGLLGPRHRTDRLLKEIESDGIAIAPAIRARLHAPVGLDLGGATPETVALSIVAEIQARLSGRTPGFLKDRTAPIHGSDRFQTAD